MPPERFTPSPSAVDAARQTSSSRYHYNCRSDSGPNARRTHHAILEPPVPRVERSSSPRHHSSTSPSGPGRTATAARSSATSPALLRPATPQRYGTPPQVWPEDEISLPSLRHDDALAALVGWSPSAFDRFSSSDDHFLSDLANHDFSSPSTYPSFTFTNPSPSGPHREGIRRQSDSDATGTAHRTQTPAPPAPRNPNPSRFTTQLSASTSFDSAPSFLTDSGSGGSFQETPQSSPGSDNMPPQTRRLSASNGPTSPNAPLGGAAARPDKRRGTGATAEASPKQSPNRGNKKRKLDDDDPFRESEEGTTPSQGDEPYMIDLTEPNGIPEELRTPVEEAPKEDNRVKLAAFQCAICMDDVTTLTVTHCGHLFCAECLHSSLHVETTKGRCPMCRQKLDIRARENYNSKTKGFWPLELKFTTTTRKGKRKAGAIS